MNPWHPEGSLPFDQDALGAVSRRLAEAVFSSLPRGTPSIAQGSLPAWASMWSMRSRTSGASVAADSPIDSILIICMLSIYERGAGTHRRRRTGRERAVSETLPSAAAMTKPSVLHGYFRSAASWRVRIALGLKGLAVRHVSHHLRRGDEDAVRGRGGQDDDLRARADGAE